MKSTKALLPMTHTGVVPWYGAKRDPVLNARIVGEIGQGHRGFGDLCCGSLAVLMSTAKVSMEVANDRNGDLINLARVIASERWVELYRRAARTLMHAELYFECRDRWSNESETIIAPSVDDVESIHVGAAWRYLVASWQGINGVCGTGRGNMGLAKRYTVGGGHGGTRWKGVVGSIAAWHERLMGVLIDRSDVFELLFRTADDGTWTIYLDPPYWKKGDKYVHDFRNEYNAEQLAEACARFPSVAGDPGLARFGDHGLLAAIASSKKATRIVVSYYDEPEVRELYRGWTFVDASKSKALVNQGMRDKKGAKTIAPEVLIINGESFTAGGLFA